MNSPIIDKQTARNGQKTLRVTIENGPFVFLHSSYDPEKEVTRWAEEIEYGSENNLILFGLDLGYHLYLVQFDLEHLSGNRGDLFAALRAEEIGVTVHYIPVHLHPYYHVNFGTGPGLCPVAENTYERILSLPLFPTMVESDIDDVTEALGKVIGAYRAPNVS